jgi:phage terminase small subunit
MPLDFLLQIMRDQDEDKGRRMQAATLAAPYCHAKKGEGGKKEEKADAAKKVASKFATATPPKLVAAGGKKV